MCICALQGTYNPSPQKPKNQYLTDYNSESSVVKVQAQIMQSFFFKRISAGTVFYLITATISRPEKLSE